MSNKIAHRLRAFPPILFFAVLTLHVPSLLAFDRDIPLKSSKKSPWVGTTIDGSMCTGKPTNFGPYDYILRKKYDYELYLVEQAHFNSYVEQLIRGANKTNELGWDIDYTLRAFPNHHRALYTVLRYRMRHGKYRHGTLAPPECYFQKAIHFNPEDGTTRMIYGILLHKLGNKSEALQQYQKAHELQPHDAQTTYNLALLLTELGHYDEALEHAHHLYKNKFPLTGLKTKLQKKGAWKEIPAEPPENNEDREDS